MEDKSKNTVKKFTGWSKIKKEDLKSNAQEETTKGLFTPLENIQNDTPAQKPFPSKPFSQRKVLDDIREQQQIIKDEIEKEGLEAAKEILKLNDPAPIICYFCGKDIRKQKWFSVYHRNEIHICMSCFYSAPKCNHCGIAVKNPIPSTITQYCQYCKLGKICDCCGKPFQNVELGRINNVKGVYCSTCINTYRKCYFCNIPLSASHTSHTIKNDVISCNLCYNRLITKKSDLEIIKNKIIRIARTNTGKNINYEKVITLDDFNADKNTVSVQDTYLHVQQNILEEEYISKFSLYFAQSLNNVAMISEKSIHLKEAFHQWFQQWMLKEFGYIEKALRTVPASLESLKLFRRLQNIENTSSVSRVFERIKEL